MSRVTNIIVHWDICEDEDKFADYVDFFMKSMGQPTCVRWWQNPLPYFYSGTKVLEAHILVFALNHFNHLDEFIEYLRMYKWHDQSEGAENLQIFVKEDEDAKFNERTMG